MCMDFYRPHSDVWIKFVVCDHTTRLCLGQTFSRKHLKSVCKYIEFTAFCFQIMYAPTESLHSCDRQGSQSLDPFDHNVAFTLLDGNTHNTNYPRFRRNLAYLFLPVSTAVARCWASTSYTATKYYHCGWWRGWNQLTALSPYCISTYSRVFLTPQWLLYSIFYSNCVGNFFCCYTFLWWQYRRRLLCYVQSNPNAQAVAESLGHWSETYYVDLQSCDYCNDLSQ